MKFAEDKNRHVRTVMRKKENLIADMAKGKTEKDKLRVPCRIGQCEVSMGKNDKLAVFEFACLLLSICPCWLVVCCLLLALFNCLF